MNIPSVSIRPFIGAKNFQESRKFYLHLGFDEFSIGPKMSYFKVDDNLGFYLQDAYVKDWIDNSMIFLEVQNLDDCQDYLEETMSFREYPTVRLSKIKNEDWGRELFMHDPSGILWHFGEFLTS